MSKLYLRRNMSIRQMLGLALIIIFLASVTVSEGTARPNLESRNLDLQVFASVAASSNKTETKTKHVTSEQTLTMNMTVSSKSSQTSTTVAWSSVVNSSRSAANYSLTSYSPLQQSTTTSIVNVSSKISQPTTDISYTASVSTTDTSSSTRLSTTLRPASTTTVSSAHAVSTSSYTTQSSTSNSSRSVANYSLTSYSPFQQSTATSVVNASSKVSQLTTNISLTGTVSTTYISSSSRLTTTVIPASTTFVSSSRLIRTSSYTTQSSRSVTVTRRISTVTTTWRESYPRGTTRAVLDASPKPAFINTPVTITGTLYGSWHPLPIKDGMVTDKPVEISADWGFSKVVNTDYYGRFTVITTAPPTSGLYNITVTFYEDQDLEGCSTKIQFQVVETIETTLWLKYMPVQQGMGSATKFYGMLQEKNSGRPVPGKTILLTVMGGGSAWTYTLTTNSQGYYELIYANNGGIFTWAESRFNGDALYLPSYSGRIARQG